MDDNRVVPPPSSSRPTLVEQTQAQHAEDIRQRWALVQAVRNADKFIDPDDVIWPAQAVDKLLAVARQKKLKTDDIEKALAKRGPEVRHWERLRIKHSYSPIQAKMDRGQRDIDNKNALVKKVQPYVRLLEAIADALGEHSDDVIYDAFQNTRFTRNVPGSSNDAIGEITFFIEEMSRAVIKAANLADYFQQARSVCAKYNPISGDFIWAKYPMMTSYDNKDRGYLKEADVSWENCPPFPGVSLLRVQNAHFTGPLLVERRSIAPAKCSMEDAARIVSPVRLQDQPPFGPFDAVAADVTIFNEVRLVIGPRTRAADLGPMFESKAFVQLATEGYDRPLTFPFSVLPLAKSDKYAGTVAARFDDGWHRVTGFGNDGWSGTEEIEPDISFDELMSDFQFDGIFGSGGWEFVVHWQPVNLQTVSQLIVALRTGQKLFETDGPDPEPTEFLALGFPELEVSLHSGALRTALVAECQRLKAKIAIRIDEAKTVREREMAASLSRLRNMADLG